jgi:O-antigen/teichoic acid export membrane protein
LASRHYSAASTDRYFSRVMSVAALQLSWRFVAGGLALVTALLVSVTLGLATQGVVATSISVLAGISVLTGSGFAHAAAFVASRRPEAAGRIADQGAVLAIVFGGLAGALATLLGPRMLPTLPVLWWQIAVALPFMQAAQLGLGLQQGLGSSRAYVAIYVSQPLVAFFVASLAALLSSRSEHVSEWAAPIVVVPFIVQGLISAVGWLSMPRRGAGEPVGSILSYTARMYPSAVAHYLSYRLDLLLIGGLLGATAAGLYSLALNSVDAVARVGQTAATVLFRRFAEASVAQGVRLARRGASAAGAVSLLVGLALAGLVILFASRGEEVRVLGRLLLLLSVGGAAVSAWTVLASYLAASNRLGAAARVNLVLLAASVLCYVSLIPAIGVYGGAIGTSIGLSIAAVLGYREVGRAPGPDRVAEPTLLRKPFGK